MSAATFSVGVGLAAIHFSEGTHTTTAGSAAIARVRVPMLAHWGPGPNATAVASGGVLASPWEGPFR